MAAYTTWGNAPLGPAGLVTFMSCGHWWTYPAGGSMEQMHALAGFSLGLACSFCIADWQTVARIHARGTATRVN